MPKQVTYRVPDDFSVRLAAFAAREGLSINKAVVRALAVAEAHAERPRTVRVVREPATIVDTVSLVDDHPGSLTFRRDVPMRVIDDLLPGEETKV